MTKEEARELLKDGGNWIANAREWLLWNKDAHGRLHWGSTDEVTLTVKEIEELALQVAIGAYKDAGKIA